MKLVMIGCATLLAFALVAPAAHAGWPPKPPRDTTPPTTPTNLRVVAATEDSVTLALERLDRQLGPDPALPR